MKTFFILGLGILSTSGHAATCQVNQKPETSQTLPAPFSAERWSLIYDQVRDGNGPAAREHLSFWVDQNGSIN
ncbi:MAG: hypothetical protein M3Q07_25335, partial [Pseudobdellovibrionaceae bacterium]|nr:hypothetical protein [Pseudobdellovibrionaceae bacterium]